VKKKTNLKVDKNVAHSLKKEVGRWGSGVNKSQKSGYQTATRKEGENTRCVWGEGRGVKQGKGKAEVRNREKGTAESQKRGHGLVQVEEGGGPI